MDEKQRHVGGFFSVVFGIMIITIGVIWFLQSMGLLPEGIKILAYAWPVCVILLGIRLITAQFEKNEGAKQGRMEGKNGGM